MPRPYRTPKQRDRAAIERAEWEREQGIPDPEPPPDLRQAFSLDLRSAGGRLLRIEPRWGFVAWRAVDAETEEVLHVAALKELLHWIADRLPRWLALRNYQ